MISLKINGQPVEVEDGSTILQAAKKLGISIPTLCHHDILKPTAACRVCIVEQKEGDWTKMVTACSSPARNGSEILTDSEEALRARQMVLGLLISRWPNVPILKQLAEQYGVTEPLFVEPEYVEAAEDACIRCGMCVRVCHEVVGAQALAFVNRGPNEDCIACGSCSHVCPTGHAKLVDLEGIDFRHSEIQLGPNTPIHVPTMQAIPNSPFIDTETCIHFKTGAILPSSTQRHAFISRQAPARFAKASASPRRSTSTTPKRRSSSKSGALS